MEVGFDDVGDPEIFFFGGFDVDINVALGVDDGGDAVGADEVGGVGQAAEEEVFDLDGHGV